MIVSKPWYTSKLVWLGIINTLIGVLALLGEFFTRNAAITPIAITELVSGILLVVLRVWFTDKPIG